MTVVATSTGAAPLAKASMAASFSALVIRPVSVPMPVPVSDGSSARRCAHSATAAGGRVDPSRSAPPSGSSGRSSEASGRSGSSSPCSWSPASMRGQTT